VASSKTVVVTQGTTQLYISEDGALKLGVNLKINTMEATLINNSMRYGNVTNEQRQNHKKVF
jgi:hypothetical protein